MNLTIQEVKDNKKITNFIKKTDHFLGALGYTDHGKRHANIVADRSKMLAKNIGLSEREQELAGIGGYCHDMGNFMGRTQHHYWSAMLFSQVFMAYDDLEIDDISTVMQSMVSHDKDEVKIVDKVTAILIIADKSDVHRDRVRNKNIANIKADIHDRVNYSIINNHLTVHKIRKTITLKLKLDTKVTDPIEYFEIFAQRMAFCRLAAKYLGYKFVLNINNFKL